MVDINLHQAAEQDLMDNRRKSMFNSTYFISLTLLVLVGCAYAGTMAYKNILVAKQANLLETKDKEMKSIDPSEINRLSDFNTRLTGTTFNLKNKKDVGGTFKLVEDLVVKDSYLKTLVYDSIENKIEMELVANSFRLAANQILSLKKSGLFEEVRVIDSSRNDNNQAVFNLEAIFKVI